MSAKGKQVQIIIHDEAQLLDWGESRATGPWIKLRLNDPELLQLFRGMDTATHKKTGHILNLTLSEGDILPAEEKPVRKFGQEAAILRKSGFFYRPEVWHAIGIDVDYQAWVRGQKCIVCGGQDWIEQKGEGRCVYAHVRRGSGVGTKPEFSGVPMCYEHHRLQHDVSELAAFHAAIEQTGALIAKKLETAREWFERKALEHVVAWAWYELKSQLGADSWSEIKPSRLNTWAKSEGVEKYLPDTYTDFGL